MFLGALLIIVILNNGEPADAIVSRLFFVSSVGLLGVFSGILMNIYLLHVFWRNWSVEISDVLHTRSSNPARDITLSREEVSYIERVAGSGLLIHTRKRSKKVFIPDVMNDYDTIVAQIASWAPLRERKSTPVFTLLVVGVVFFIPFGLLLGTNNIVVAVLSILILLGSIIAAVVILIQQKI
jgi:ABC-type siderophore export system fused ATPase/permease subunit